TNYVIETACDSYTGLSGTTWTTTGLYVDTIDNVNNCDSITTYSLKINHTTTNSITETVCDTYTGLDGSVWTTSGTYVDTIENSNGCDSITTYNLTINYSSTGIDTQVACDSYMWIDGNTYTSSNNTATHTLTNAANCDSVVTLDLTINYSDAVVDDVTACDSYTWIDGNTYTSSNTTATHTLTNAANCDSVVTLNLSINYSASTVLTENICAGDFFIVGSSIYTASGNYVDVLETSDGCDSVVSLALTVNDHSSNGFMSINSCEESLMLNDELISESGVYFHYLTNALGCDSLMVYNISLSHVVQESQVIEVCQEQLEVNGEVFTSSGVYTQNLTSSAGCDSILTLTLLFSNPIVVDYEASFCSGSGVVINGETFLSSGQYTQLLQTADGCDSTVNLTLTIGSPSAETQITESICETSTYTWDGVEYDQTGYYTNVYENASGCDSIVNLDLTVNSETTVVIDTTLCNASEFTFETFTTTMSGYYTVVLDDYEATCVVYNIDVEFVTLVTPSVSLIGNILIVDNLSLDGFQWYDCATDAPISGATDSFYIPTENGEYYVVVNQNGCEETSGCIEVKGIGLDEFESSFVVYPNPSIGQFTIQILNDFKHDEFVIHSALGQEVYRLDAGEEQEIKLDLDLAPGIYYLRSNYEGKANGVTRLVIQY
ncbi:MAG: T9SS type A sorting domain-containing protein, partial [Flavobacteriales bacterium]